MYNVLVIFTYKIVKIYLQGDRHKAKLRFT